MPGQKRDPSRVVRGCVIRGMGEEGGCWLRRIGGLENWPCPGVEPGEGPRAGARHGLLGCARVGVRRRAEVFAIERTPLVWRGEGEEVAVGAPGTKCRRVVEPPAYTGGRPTRAPARPGGDRSVACAGEAVPIPWRNRVTDWLPDRVSKAESQRIVAARPLYPLQYPDTSKSSAEDPPQRPSELLPAAMLQGRSLSLARDALPGM